MRGAGTSCSPSPPTAPTTTLSSQPSPGDTENVPQVALSHSSSHNSGLLLAGHNFLPLLTSVKRLTKSRPETLTCANHQMSAGRKCAPSPEEPAEHPLFLGLLLGSLRGIAQTSACVDRSPTTGVLEKTKTTHCPSISSQGKHVICPWPDKAGEHILSLSLLGGKRVRASVLGISPSPPSYFPFLEKFL